MSLSGLSTWHEGRVERALLWFLRIVLFLLVLSALLTGEFSEALLLLVVLAVHSAVYWVVSRSQSLLLQSWVLTLADVVSAGLAFYVSSDAVGQGSLLVVCVMALVAARFGLWAALALNAGVGILFSWPVIYSWLWLSEPFSPRILGNLILWLALTWGIHYVVSVEARQTRTGQDLSRRLRQLSTVYDVGRTITSTLELETVLDLVVTRAVEILDVRAGFLFLLDEKTGDLVLRVGSGPGSASVVGQRLPADEGFAWAVIHAGQGQIADDIEADAHWLLAPDGSAGSQVRSVMCVPLISRGNAVGALELIDRLDGMPFAAEDLELLSSFAVQAAVAVENARLYESTDEALSKRVQELATLEEIDHELGVALDHERVIDLVLERAIEVCNANSGLIGILPPDGTRLDPLFWRGQEPETATGLPVEGWPVDRGIVGRVVRTGKSVLLADVNADPDYEPVIEATRSEMAVPIKREGRVIGVLNLESDQLAAFGREDLRFMEHLAEHAGMAMESARLYEETQRHLREVKGLNQISEVVGSLTDIHRIHAQIAERVARLMEVEMCGILAYSPDEQALVGQPPFLGVSDEIASRYHLPLSNGSKVWQLWEEQEYLLLNDLENDPLAGELGLRGLEWATDLRDMVLAAMVVGQRRIGAILIANKVDGTPFSEDEGQLLCMFANQAATVVENARLFETQQRQLRELGILFETSAAISSSLELREVLSTVARHMAYALEVSSCTISDWDPDRNLVTTLVAEATSADHAAALSTHDIGVSYALAEYPATAWVLRERQPLVVQASDPEADEAERALLEAMGQQSALLMPLQTRDRVVGLLELYESRHTREFLADDIRLCRALANQAAVAIDNAQLYEQTDERLRDRIDELTALQLTMQELNATLELDRILQVVLESAVQTVEASHGNVMLVDIETGQFAVRAALGYTLAEEAVIAEQLLHLDENNIVYQVAQSRQARIVVNTAQEQGVVCVRQDTRSALVVPVFYQDVVVGLINLRQTRVGAFDQEDLTFVRALAQQAAIAIGNAMRFEEQLRLNTALRQRTEQMDGLLAVSQKLRADAPLEDVLEEVAYAIQETVGFNIVLISVVEDLQSDVPMLQRVAAAGLPLEVFEEARRVRQPLERYEHILTGEYRLGLCYFFPFQKEEEWGADLHTLVPLPEIKEWHEGEWHPRDMLLAPLRGAGGRLLGHISVDAPQDGLRPNQRTLEVLAIFANQASIAYQNAYLFQERQQRIEQLNVLNQMAQAISSTLQLDALLEVVYRQTSRLVDTTNFYIALYDEETEQITFPFVVDPENREDWQPRSKGEGLTGAIIETGEPILLPTGAAGLYRESDREIQTGLCCSWLGVPMSAEDRVLGVIAVQDYEREHVYHEEHLHLMSTVAAQAAVAVRNAQLYQQIVGFSSELESMVEARTRDLEEALAELTIERDRVETLYRITRELGATLDLDRVLQRALQLFADVLGLEHGTILLVEPESGQLTLRATLEPGRRLPRGGKPTPWRPGEGLAGWVLEHREPALVTDITQDPRWVHRDGKELKIRSAMAAPLSLGGGDVLGVLVLGHQQVGHFGQEHLQLITAATAQIAIAVNNSDLYAFITEQADQLGSALQAQQEEAAKNRAILESIADGVLVLAHNGRVMLVNPAAEELLGFAAIGLEGEHFRHMLGLGETVVHRELAQALYSELQRRLEGGEETALTQDASVRLHAGNRALAVHMAPLMITLGGALGLVAALRDISREAEVERLKNEFISTVSHELRTPMTSIKGYTDLLFLGMAGGLTDAQRSFLKIIKSNADRLTALVNDILDISRIETGRMHLTIDFLDLTQLISQVVVDFTEQYREKGLTLEWDEPEQLPLVRGDAARVTQVLGNLVANAWRYTPKGGRTTISVRPVNGFLQVDVADTGIGISPDDLGRIFDRFYRADHPVVQEVEGTGLGLSIVKMFVEMLGGEIWVDSQLGTGSTFSFTLPLASTELPEPVPALLSAELAAGISRRPKILVIEDDRDLALLLRRKLESEGYQVLLAGTGEDALWLAKESQPQLITLDIMLPDLDGFVVLERLKRDPATSAIPVVIISVLTDTEKGYALGAVDYVVKPFEEARLLEAVGRALHFTEQARPQTLLVADDDPKVLTRLEEVLSLHGYEVWTACDGQEALTCVGERQPDLILLDTKMPGMDGWEVIRRLKSDEVTRPIPIIVITESPLDKEQDRVRVLGAEVRQYLAKPLSIEMLIHGIKKAMMDEAAV